LKDDLAAKYKLTILNDALKMLRARLDSLQKSDVAKDQPPRKFLGPNDLGPNEAARTLATSTLISITALDYVRHYATYGIPYGQDLTTPEKALAAAKTMTFTLFTQDHLRELKVRETPEYKKELDQARLAMVYQKLRARIQTSIEVSEQEVRDYYEQYKNTFAEPRKIRISEILVTSPGEADSILAVLKSGIPLTKLAALTIRAGIGSKGGDLGYLNPGDYGIIYDEAAKLKVGEYGGPLAVDGGFSVFKVIDIIEPVQKPFGEVAKEIKATLARQKYQSAMMEAINQQKAKVENYVNVELLKNNLKTGKIKDEN